MPTSYTTLLGLAKPVTGELTGTWGDTVNSYITEYLDDAVAGAQVISGSQTAVTLSTTNGSSLVQAGAGASGSSQYAIIRCTGNPAGMLTITAPATSKSYLIINATSTSQSVKIVGAGPTTGVTIATGIAALVAWNGSDFALIASTDAVKLSTLGTGVATALGQNVTGSGGIVLAVNPSIDRATFTGNAQTTPFSVPFNATAMVIDCTESNVFTVTMTDNVTIAPTLSNPQNGQTINWFIIQDSTGGRTMTWPSSFKWVGSVSPVLSSSANAVDLVVATYLSSTAVWYASISRGFA